MERSCPGRWEPTDGCAAATEVHVPAVEHRSVGRRRSSGRGGSVQLPAEQAQPGEYHARESQNPAIVLSWQSNVRRIVAVVLNGHRGRIARVAPGGLGYAHLPGVRMSIDIMFNGEFQAIWSLPDRMRLTRDNPGFCLVVGRHDRLVALVPKEGDQHEPRTGEHAEQLDKRGAHERLPIGEAVKCGRDG